MGGGAEHIDIKYFGFFSKNEIGRHLRTLSRKAIGVGNNIFFSNKTFIYKKRWPKGFGQ